MARKFDLKKVSSFFTFSTASASFRVVAWLKVLFYHRRGLKLG